MKHLFSFFMIALMGLFVVSCDNSDDRGGGTDYDTYPVMRDATGTFNASNGYTLTQSITMSSSDVALVYRNINSGQGGSAVWQLIPKTEYLSDGRELDYNFLFNNQSVEIYTEANFDQATMSSSEKTLYLNNQTFRIVLVPASSSAATMDHSNYNAVMGALKADLK